MRNISFALTTKQFLDGTKTVTRRTRWEDLKPGEFLMAVEKSQGLKKGEKVKQLGVIQIVSVRRERLNQITYPECRLEGFPHLNPAEFVSMFREHMKVEPDADVTRIEFRRVGPTTPDPKSSTRVPAAAKSSPNSPGPRRPASDRSPQ